MVQTPQTRRSEVMTPDMQANLVVSAFTLALLHDSGWYRPDYAQAGALTWGAQKGCPWVCLGGELSI